MESPCPSVPFRNVPNLATQGAGLNRKRGVNRIVMTRKLVLTNEAAGNRFRRSLPPPVIAPAPRGDDHDLKLFVLSFTAFFICFYTMIM